VSEQIDRALAHLIPSVNVVGNPLTLSTDVEGLIARAKGSFVFAPGEFASTVTALISKPAALASTPTVTLAFRLSDGVGNPLITGSDFLASSDPFMPNFVLMPVVFDPVGGPPASVRRKFWCDVTVDYTPIGGGPESISQTIGPVPVDLSTTLIPFMTVLTEHAIGDARFPGRVLLGVPQNSPLVGTPDAFATLGNVNALLSNIVTVLGLLGIAVPPALSASVTAIGTVTGLAVGRFRKADLIPLFEWVWGIPPWDDWQGIMSTTFAFGPASRRVSPGSPLPFEAFSLFPSSIGVAAIPDLSVFPLSASVGTPRQDFPLPPAPPPGGSYNDAATSVDFPVP
jgi:hypothetical protein